MAELRLTDEELQQLAERLAPLIVSALRDSVTGACGEADRWMRTTEAAEYLGMSKSELHRRAAAGAVPHEQEAPGAALYFRRADLDAWRRGER
jgi:excisionase family DNA binding protein